MENIQKTNQNSETPQSNTDSNTNFSQKESLSASESEEIKESNNNIASDSLDKNNILESKKEISSCKENNLNSNDESSKASEEKNIESDKNNDKLFENSEKTKLEESSKDKTNFDDNSNDSSNKEQNTNNSFKKYLFKVIDYILEKNIFSKIFVIIFATIVFSYAYSHQESITRSALSYIGLILCVIVCYVEILGIRDHIWLIEGSIPATKQWREAFFTPSTLRKHKIRKMIILLFTFLVFVGIYRLKCFVNYRDAISFLGIILIVTIVYYEILAVRDEIDLVSKSLRQKVIDEQSKKESKEADEIN